MGLIKYSEITLEKAEQLHDEFEYDFECDGDKKEVFVDSDEV